jgi:hypothetical protein
MFTGYFLRLCNLPERIIAGLGALIFLIHIIRFNYMVFMIGIVIIGFLTLKQIIANKSITLTQSQ